MRVNKKSEFNSGVRVTSGLPLHIYFPAKIKRNIGITIDLIISDLRWKVWFSEPDPLTNATIKIIQEERGERSSRIFGLTIDPPNHLRRFFYTLHIASVKNKRICCCIMEPTCQ